MIFKRRHKRSFMRKLRDVFLPRKGWLRGISYIRQRLKRIQGSPHSIALGFSCGVFTSFTPFFGVHFLLAALIAWILRGNILASAFGTAFGNPLTFPFIAALCLKIGDWILYSTDMSTGRPFTMAMVFDHPSYFWNEILLPYLIGGIVPGLVCGIATYFLLFGGIKSYQVRKRARLKKAAAKRLEIYNRAHNIGNHKNTENSKKEKSTLEDSSTSSKYSL
jgi:uncharacterized protein